ncbi:hypothetical protein ACCS64_37210, partial [Rhizobium ruizarguesonis]
MSGSLATFAGERRKASQHGGLLAGASAKFAKASDQACGGDGSDAGNGDEDVEAAAHLGLGADAALDLDVQSCDMGVERGKPARQFLAQEGGHGRLHPV